MTFEDATMPPALPGPVERPVVRPVECVRTVAALYVEPAGCYVGAVGVDPWAEARDARAYNGPHPVVAHPPCQRWGRFWHGSTRKPHQFFMGDDRGCFLHALASVRRWGGVLEHPAESTLWAHEGMPAAGRAPDAWGGWTAEVRQCDWGHKAEKRTWLYIVGCHPDDLPAMPPRGEPTGVIKPQRGIPRDGRKIVTKAEREHTPPKLAAWLVELAGRCRRKSA